MLVLVGACGDSSEPGEVGAHCYPNGTCNVGLSCSGGFCYPSDASLLADASPIADAPVAFQCADDSILEGVGKNDTIQTAYATPVAIQRKDLSLAGLAICPEGDKDTYTVNIVVANSNLEAVSTWQSGMPVSISILGSGGATLNNGIAGGGMELRAYVASLPVGTYYVQTYAAADVKNNYSLAITVTP